MIPTRETEEKLARLFAACRPFSEHLAKWEDPALPDKYDHNCFEYTGQPSKAEFEQALDYQKKLGASFIKLEGNEPLTDRFELEEGVTLTMVLKTAEEFRNRNRELTFRKPALSEVEEIEVRHFGPVYGEDFSRRNIRRLYEKLAYHGAYLGETLVGACYSFTSDGLTCIDGLIVDAQYRHRYAATSLLAHIRETYPETTLFLHADQDDTPKDMYRKMGFETVDRLYEYVCTRVEK